jgi:signal peptidase II
VPAAARRAPDPDRIFWTLTALLVALDAWTKRLAEAGHPWLDALARGSASLSFPLTYNPGVAFSLRVDGGGDGERWLYVMALTWVLVFLYALFRRVAPVSPTSMFGLALLHGAGAGNLLDRVRGARGVVDFIRVDAGVLSGLVFNVADVAAVCGGALLLVALVRRECAPARLRAAG